MSDEALSRNRAVRALNSALDKAASIGRPAVHAYIRAARTSNPHMSPAEAIGRLNRQFVATTAASGAAAGGVAAAPGVGTAGGVAAATVDAFGFTGMLGMYTLALAEIYDLPTDDLVRHRTLILAVMLGGNSETALRAVAERTGAHWGRRIVTAVPRESLVAVNRVLGRNFVTKYGTKQGLLVLGKTVPFGLGAAIGAGGNVLFASIAIKSGARLFGPPPKDWPDALRDPNGGPPEPVAN